MKRNNRSIYWFTPSEEKQLGVEYRPLDSLLAECDFVSLYLRRIKETERMIGIRELSLKKPTGFSSMLRVEDS
jgi:phosphoglycerate dehydrogenase-like enzyme